MRRPRNPVRRNRKLGTKAHGAGQDNRLVIPGDGRASRGRPSRYWERLGPHTVDVVHLGGHAITFLVERTRPGWVHPVSKDDIVRVIVQLPARVRRLVSLVVLRQPTKKQGALAPVWGRLAFHAVIGPHEGPAIFIEAVRDGMTIRWPRSLAPGDAAELERLREDGHEVVAGKRGYALATKLDAVRRTVLSRTLLHEYGHAVDYDRWVWRRSEEDPSVDVASLSNVYWSRPSVEREAFAHRVAANLRAKLRMPR